MEDLRWKDATLHLRPQPGNAGYCMCYTSPMAKETTLNEIGEMLSHVVKHMATKDDITEVRRELKGDIVRVSEQVASIETQLRGMQHVKLQSRVADLEEKVFGAARA